MFGIVTHAILFTTIQILFVSADYQCLCNYNVELAVYSNENSASHVFGYLYEFDCKPVYAQAAKGSTFYQIQFENKVGYVTNGNGIQIQVCRGNIPNEDLVTATSTLALPMTSPTTTAQQIKTNMTTLSVIANRLTSFNTAQTTTQFVQNMTSFKSTAAMSSFIATVPTTRSTASSATSPITLPSTISSTTPSSTRSSTTMPTSTTRSTPTSPSTRPPTTMPPSTTRSTSTSPSTRPPTILPPSTTRYTSTSPSTRPSTTMQPSTTRSTSPSPSSRPSTTMPPSTTRSTSTSPSTRPSTTMLPSTTRSTSTLPSTRPSTTMPPSTTRSSTTSASSPSTAKSTTTKRHTVHTTEKPSCPSGWIMYGTSCYLFHTNSQRHWTDANNDCVSKNAHLAIIESVDEFSFIKHQLGSRINTHASESDTAAWIAGRDNNNEGTWEWYDGLTNTYKQITYTKWGNNEPDSGDGEHDEDCMTMVGNKDFKWADYPCKKNMFYVCEQSALAPTPNPPKQTTGQNCPAGWVMDHGSCYFFHTSKRYSWSGANNDCLNKNSRLAEIDTETEFNFLKQQLGQRIDSERIHDDSDTSAWVAGTDHNHEGDWEWYNGFTNTYKPVIYKNWGHDEPNSDDGDEDCIAMVAHKSYKWADYDCDTKMFYVCEQSPTLLAAQTQYPTKQPNGANCPSGWIQNHGSCYFFHTNSHYTWHDANAYCSRRQAHLAIIETSEEDNFLKQESSQRIPDGEHGSNSGLWVAGSDDDYEGHWEWIDGFSHTSKPMQGYSNWHHGEPDSGDGDHDEDCMCMIGGSGAEWQDYKCTKHMYFICEKSIMFAAPLIG